MKTLIVENDYTGRLLLEELLKSYGPIQFAGNGADAVRAVRESLANNDRFDLICMDVMMPVMDGLEAVEKIRDLEASHGIPLAKGSKIIMTTVLSDSGHINKAFANLCNDYIFKPIKQNELTDKLRTLGLIS